MRKTTCALAAAIAVAGCKSEIAVDLYAADLIEGDATEMLAPAILSLESASSAECQSSGTETLAALTEDFPAAEFIGCTKKDFTDFAQFRVPVPISGIATGGALTIRTITDSQGTHVWVDTNPDAVRQIWNRLPESMTQYRAFTFEPTITATFHNDTVEPIDITTDDVFADGQPIAGTDRRNLARRGQTEIRLSDVSNAAFAGAEATAHIVTINRD